MNTTTGASSPTGQNMRRKTPVIGLAAHLVRGIQRVATDAVVGRVRSMPRAAADLDAAFLSQIMRRTVTSVAVIGGDAGDVSARPTRVDRPGRPANGVRQDARRDGRDAADG
jgi:hypothetical protein